MKISYKIINFELARKDNLPYWEDWEFKSAYYDDECYHNGIWRCEDDIPVEFIGEDGGEPEDQTLTRDWSWVANALNNAYELGKN